MTEEVARLLDPILRAEIERMRSASADWALLLDHLTAAGPSELEDFQEELGLRAKDLKAIRSPLERCGAVVSRSYGSPPRAADTSTRVELARWDQVYPERVGGDVDLKPLVVAGLRAAVVAQERELPRWFSWQWYWQPGLIDELVDEGRLWRPEPGWVSAAETASGRAPAAPAR